LEIADREVNRLGIQAGILSAAKVEHSQKREQSQRERDFHTVMGAQLTTGRQR
jgi:hypothetical protein